MLCLGPPAPSPQRKDVGNHGEKPGKIMKYLEVSWNGGTPKSSMLLRFSIINQAFWGSPINGNPMLESQSRNFSPGICWSSGLPSPGGNLSPGGGAIHVKDMAERYHQHPSTSMVSFPGITPMTRGPGHSHLPWPHESWVDRPGTLQYGSGPLNVDP